MRVGEKKAGRGRNRKGRKKDSMKNKQIHFCNISKITQKSIYIYNIHEEKMDKEEEE
jgi:hypothetical protein